MNSHIDFRTMPANAPVLCIPRVYPNISESRIRRIFDDLNMGTLERIDIVTNMSTGLSKHSVSKHGVSKHSVSKHNVSKHNASKHSASKHSASKHNASKHSANKGEQFNRVFVHFRCWNDTENANIARERLLNGKEIKIIYDDPWFWKISAYREPPKHSKATLHFDSDEDRDSNLTSYRESTPPRTPPRERACDKL